MCFKFCVAMLNLVLNDCRQVDTCCIGRHFLSASTHHTLHETNTQSPKLLASNIKWNALFLYIYISLIVNPGWFFQHAEIGLVGQNTGPNQVIVAVVISWY